MAKQAALPSPHMDAAQIRRPNRVTRMALIIGLAVVFGIVAAWIKGNDIGLRDAIGNVSAVWLLLPFLAGANAGTHRVLAAALCGLAATLAALTGFYFAESFVLDLGPHPWLTDLSLTMGTVAYYAERGLVTGPLFGALGYWWQQRRSLTAAGVLAATFVLEPVAWWLYGLHIGGSAAYPVPGYPALWLSEIAIGLVGFVLLRRMARREAAPV
jgi:Family of unknown function (DUF6518)